MSRYVQFVILLVYMGIFIFGIFYFISMVFNSQYLIRESIFAFVISFIFCVGAIYWLPFLFLWTNNIRRPLKKERVYLQECLDTICGRCGEPRKFRLLIAERQNTYAFAIGINTVVIAKDFLESISRSELEAVLAHELGHLRTRDTIAGCMLMVATFIPQQLTIVWRSLVRYLKRSFRRHILLWTIVFLMLILMMLYHARGNFIGFTIILLGINAAVYSVFIFSWRMVLRFTEYRQDEFAASLGYAEPLKNVLEKIRSESTIGNISTWNTIIHSTHPSLHNRIIRLEEYMEKAS